MARKGKRGRAALPSAEEVLSGRVRVSFTQCFALINAVNPTGEDIDEASKLARYATKTKLIDYLIRTHQGDLEVERDANDADVVSIRRRAHPADACHAVILELDDDARSWVRAQLDAASWVDNEAPADVVKEATQHEGSALDRARAALAEYDYEAAKQLFESAAATGSREAVEQLIELNVDLLAADEDALRVAKRIDPARMSAQTRCLLGIAAARLERDKDAMRWIEHNDSVRVGEVLATLTGTALRAGDLDASQDRLRILRERCPGHEAIIQLEDGVAALRSESRAPAERTIVELYDSGDLDSAESEARALLTRWPNSEVARRIVRDVSTRRREIERGRLVANANEAISQDNLHRAIELLTLAKSVGATDVDSRIDELRATVAVSDARARVVRVLTHLADGGVQLALQTYATLAAEDRDAVRRVDDAEIFTHVESLLALRSRSKPAEIAAACMSVMKAEGALGRGDDRAAEIALAPHVSLLLRGVSTRAVVEAVRRASTVRSSAHATEKLEAAEQAVFAGDYATAQAALQQVEAIPRDLADRAASVTHQVTLGSAIERHTQSYRRAVTQFAFFEALGAIDELIGLTSDDEQRSWQEARERTEASLFAAWRLLVVNECTQDILTDDLDPGRWLDHCRRLLTPDSEYAFFVDAWSRWLFVRKLDVATNSVVEAVSMRTPAPMTEADAWLDGDTLIIVGGRVHYLRLCTRTWAITQWQSQPTHVGADVRVDMLKALPRTRFAWLETSTIGAHEPSGRLLDLERGRVHREISNAVDVVPLGGNGDFVAIGDGRASARFTADGKRAERLEFGDVIAAVTNPRGDGLVAACQIDPDASGDDRLHLVTVDAARAIRQTLCVDDASVSSRLHLAATSAAGLVALLWRSDSGSFQIRTWHASRDGLEPAWSTDAPSATCFLSDLDGHHLVAAASTTAGLQIEPVRSGALRFDEGVHNVRFPRYPPTYACSDIPGAQRARRLALAARVKGWSRSHYDHWMEEQGMSFTHDPEHMMASIMLGPSDLALTRAPNQELMDLAVKLHPRHGGLARIKADSLVYRRKWEEVIELLSPFEAAPESTGHPRHALHLLATAHLYQGEFHTAKRLFERARNYGGPCELDKWVELAALLAKPVDDDTSAPTAAHVLGALRACSDALDEGDLATARRILDRPWMRRTDADDVAYCRARLWLSSEPVTPAERFNKTLVLAQALHRHGATSGDSVPLLSTTRRSSVIDEAIAWLESSCTQLS